MVDDYYLVLGISRDAGMTQIRRAYRRLSYRFHPEVVGHEGLEHFQRIRQAYETLVRPTARTDYDRNLDHAEQSRQSASPQTRPLFDAPIDVMRDFETVSPGSDQVLAHVLGNFTGHPAKSNPTRELRVELVLTPDQARQGGHVVMLVPAARVCNVCGGSGRAGFFVCDSCGGHGTIWERASVDVHIPANVHDGASVQTSLRHLGIRNMWLTTHVRIAQQHA